jgi:L-fucose mutarotase/ribose pyranase (RbsD/FucU family)
LPGWRGTHSRASVKGREMKFPAYIPAAVREYVTKLIEGDSWEPVGLQESLAHAERRLTELDEKIQSCIRWGKDDYLPGLEKERAEALAHRDSLAGDIDCLRRLVQDERMREAYAILTCEFTDDRQWRNFIYAAWAARVDFAKYRERLKQAKELADEIAQTAETLAKLIRQFSATGISGPSEFYSIPELLRQTDNHELEGHNLHMWRSMRRHILGDPPERDVQVVMSAEEGGEPMAPIEIVRVPIGEKPEITPEEEARNMLRYAWGAAPGVPELLETVARAARTFKPSAPGMFGAAIKSRQHNPKTEFLRAFGKLLTDEHGFTLTTPIMRAMAVAATVVINLPDVDVTRDDARKALAKLGVERLENPS